MSKKIYSVKDAKAEVFNTPFYQSTHGEAERSFTRLVQDEKSIISQFPDDYDLYCLGEFDDRTGLIATLDTPLHVAKANNMLQS